MCLCGNTFGCYLCNPNFHNQPYPNYGTAIPVVTPKGWECPKCTRIYAPTVTECCPCNSLVTNGIVVKEGSR